MVMGLLLFCNCVYKSLLCLHEMNIPGVIRYCQEIREGTEDVRSAEFSFSENKAVTSAIDCCSFRSHCRRCSNGTQYVTVQTSDLTFVLSL
jgi:hypothetical protein